jgi:hypothetical protein
VVVTEPLRCQNTVGVLSCSAAMVISVMLLVEAMTSGCATAAASSRSLLVMVPVGLDVEIRRDLMVSGRRWRHTNAWYCGWASEEWSVGMKKTPPSPMPLASVAPITKGGDGTSSNSRVGRESKLCASHRKSSRKSWASLVR